MHYDKKHGPIHKSIQALDKMGMDIIETGDPDAFKKYLLEFDNTICGRHPISVFLHVSTLLLNQCAICYHSLSASSKFVIFLFEPFSITNMFPQMLKNCSTRMKINFLRYEQSSQCKSMRDSSVSYASAAAKADA